MKSLTKTDKHGNLINNKNWEQKFLDKTYRHVKHTNLWWGGSISTVWIGVHSIEFETRILWWKKHKLLDTYSTLQKAEEGHALTVKEWKNPLRRKNEFRKNN